MSQKLTELLIGIVACALVPTAGHAQSADEGLGETLVTATRTGDSKVQATPMAVTVLSADALSAAGVVNTQDLVALTPNLNIAQSQNAPEIYIRGVGTNNVFNGSDPDVTTQLDGVYISRPYAQLTDYLDVQRIEVLRGPQGTLYGRNAVGGTINIISRLPTNYLSAQALIEAGDYSRVHAQSYVSGPLMPGVVDASIAADYLRHSAYVNNINPGHEGVNNANHGGVKGQLLITPNEQLQLITRLDYSLANERQDSYDHLLVPWPHSPLANSTIGDYHKIAIDGPQNARTEVWGVAEEINYRLNAHLSLKSLTSFRGSDYLLYSDADGTELPQNLTFVADNDHVVTQEFDLTGNYDRVRAVAGLFYLHESDLTHVAATVPPIAGVTPATSSFLAKANPIGTIRSEAAFVQGTYDILETLHLTAGIRYTQDKKSVDQTYYRTSLNPATPGQSFPGFPFVGSGERTFSAPTPKFGLDWQITPAAMLYASVTRGWKSGGTNYAAANVAALTFAPERLLAYESGLKTDWLDHRLRLNVTGFDYIYDDLQVQSLIGPGNTAIANAANAKITGVEFESMAKPISNLVLTVNYSILHANYDRFTNAAVPGALGPYLVGNPNYNAATHTYNASGNQLNDAPRSSYTLSAEYDQPIWTGKAFARAEDFWQGKVFFDPSNSPYQEQRSYSLLNLSVGYTDTKGVWTAQLMARNLRNTQYLTTVAANGVEPAGLAGPPRTISVQFTKNWSAKPE
jgi:iron complex outermembrane recepter protein